VIADDLYVRLTFLPQRHFAAKKNLPFMQAKTTVRPRCQGRRVVAFIGAKRRPFTEEAGGSGAGLARACDLALHREAAMKVQARLGKTPPN
jgi:hypothetical protein